MTQSSTRALISEGPRAFSAAGRRGRPPIAPIVAALLAVLAAGCPKRPPATPNPPAGPNSTWVGMSTSYRVVTSARGSVRYVMDWNDHTFDTTDPHPPAETTAVSHAWSVNGTYALRVRALLDADQSKASEWSQPKAVGVGPNSAPAIDTLVVPRNAIAGIRTSCRVRAHDPDGDDVTITVHWGDGRRDTLRAASPADTVFSHVFSRVETTWVRVRARDIKLAESVEESAQVAIGEAGGVIWTWSTIPDPVQFRTTPVVAWEGSDSVVYAGSAEDPHLFGLETHSGQKLCEALPKNYQSGVEFFFTGHGAYSASIGRLIVSSDESELYGFDKDLHREWVWPDSPPGSLFPLEIGTPAVSGSSIYVPVEDDRVCFLIADADSVDFVSSYTLASAVSDVPVVDDEGCVLVGTEGGSLYRLNAQLNTVLWQVQLEPGDAVFGPVLGGDGTIYCGSDAGRLFALKPDSGRVLWSAALDGTPRRPAVGRSSVIVGTDNGSVYALDLVTGSTIWSRFLGDEFTTTPILTAPAGGAAYLYVQDNEDHLYCLDQADGDVIWSCDLPEALGRRRQPRAMRTNDDIDPSPTILSNGNVVAVGMASDAVYCVKGYRNRPLDTDAPWPKWQHDIANTGRK